MAEPFEVIAAFVDGERVDPGALKHALSGEDGRDYLVDILALREVVDDRAVAVSPVAVRPRRLQWLTAAAVVALCLIGGYAVGHQSGRVAGETSVKAAANTPPLPSRVIEVTWQETSGGH